MRTPLCDNYGSDKGACRPNDIECASTQKNIRGEEILGKIPYFCKRIEATLSVHIGIKWKQFHALAFYNRL